jgi:hypothetical protein
MNAEPPLAESAVAGLWCVVYLETPGVTVLCYDSPQARRCPWGARVVRDGAGVRVAGEIGQLRSHRVGGSAMAEVAVLKWVAGLGWT